MKIANRDARKYVQSRREFKGSNINAATAWHDPDQYMVWSYDALVRQRVVA